MSKEESGNSHLAENRIGTVAVGAEKRHSGTAPFGAFSISSKQRRLSTWISPHDLLPTGSLDFTCLPTNIPSVHKPFEAASFLTKCHAEDPSRCLFSQFICGSALLAGLASIHPVHGSASPPPHHAMSSEDSDTVLLDPPTANTPASNAVEPDSASRPAAPSRASTFGTKKCWICMSDATEDDPNNPPVWRSPCVCSLTAHEACLLDWVADLENPKNHKSTNASKIECPQCKSEIQIARPKSYIVQGYRAVDRAIGRMVLPTIGASLAGTIWAGAWVHGFCSVWLVFGPDDATVMFLDAQRYSSWMTSYALIPLNLIFARTNYADFVLPSSTLFLLSTQMRDRFEIDMTIWPPLPSTVFACLPVMRSAYNWGYQKAFQDLNKKWLGEIQPTHAQADVLEADGMGIQDQEQDAGEGEIILQLEVNYNADPAMEGGGQAGAADDNEGQAQPGNGHVHQILGERGDQLVEGTSGIGQIVLGALAFPAVAASMGSLLGWALPSSWLGESNYMNGRPALLRTKWGRSVVGGCLFVVLKDALVLYCRWRIAQGHRSRRIMNYDKKTKKYSV